MLQVFIDAIHARRLLRVTFFSREDGHNLTRKCAPMDYGPSRNANDKTDRFQLWDFESDEEPHPLPLRPEHAVSMDVLDERFDPATFVTWDTSTRPWFVARDWGQYS